jgi:hypothetical protein
VAREGSATSAAGEGSDALSTGVGSSVEVITTS